MPSPVYWGSPRQARLEANETLPAKLDLVLEQLHLRDRVKDETVVIKMHTGNNIVCSTIHPVVVRKVVEAVKDGGGKPFIANVSWDARGAEERGYSSETLGCPVYPAAGPHEDYCYPHAKPFKNIREWHVAGFVQDATFMINFAHAKGHPTCSYGGAFKNIALGCMAGRTRSAMHDAMQYDHYWFPEKRPDKTIRQGIIDACPHAALLADKQDPCGLHLHMEQCNQWGRRLQVAPPGSLNIAAVNFHAFQEACALSTSVTLSTFDPGKVTHLVLATHMTPLCDSFGFTSMPILPDAGIFCSDDIVALDQAVLDLTGQTRLIEENLPTAIEVHTREGHPLRWLHGPLKDPYLVVQYGEQLGLGSQDYELVDVLPAEQEVLPKASYIRTH